MRVAPQSSPTVGKEVIASLGAATGGDGVKSQAFLGLVAPLGCTGLSREENLGKVPAVPCAPSSWAARCPSKGRRVRGQRSAHPPR